MTSKNMTSKNTPSIETDNPIMDADLESLGNAARDPNDFVGRPLKFKKGPWEIAPKERDGKPHKVGDTETFVVDPLSYANGWIRWENRRPVERHIYRPIDGWILPVRERLGFLNQDDWPLDSKLGKRVDPWQEQHQIVLKCLAEGDDGLLTWATTSYYGIKGMRRFLDGFVREAKKYPGRYPVVVLGTKTEHSPNYGEIAAPVLVTVDWQPFGSGSAPPGSRDVRLPAPATLAIKGPHESEAAEIIPPTSRQTKSGELDDEIPF